MKAVYALYSDPDAAQRAVDSLQSASGDLGFAKRQIVVVSAEPFDGYEFSDEHAHSHIFLLSALGGIVGGLAGYWLTSLTQRAYPIVTGGMPVVPSWTNGIIVYEMTMLGATLCTLITLLITARLPHFGSRLSDPEIWSGKILVGVADFSPAAQPQIEKRLLQAGAGEIKTSA
jgi:hypothetical protein